MLDETKTRAWLHDRGAVMARVIAIAHEWHDGSRDPEHVEITLVTQDEIEISWADGFGDWREVTAPIAWLWLPDSAVIEKIAERKADDARKAILDKERREAERREFAEAEERRTYERLKAKYAARRDEPERAPVLGGRSVWMTPPDPATGFPGVTWEQAFRESEALRAAPKVVLPTGCTCGADTVPGRAGRGAHSTACPLSHGEA